MSINKAIISGNLTRDPELRQTASGSSVLNFGVAVNDRVLNQRTNEWEDRPNFIDCVMFGKRAESLSRFLAKGAKVAIEGKLRWSQWQTKEGANRSKVEVIVDELELMSRGQQQAQGYQAAPQQPAYQQQAAPQQQPYQPAMVNVPQQQVAPSMYDEDIPF